MKSSSRTMLTYLIPLTWMTISLILSIYASRMSYVPIVMATNWNAFGDVLKHISPLSYLLNLLGAFSGVMLFSLACLSFGLGILGKQITSHSSKLATVVTAFLIGEIMFSLIFLTIISIDRLTPVLVIIAILLGFMAGFPVLKAFITQLSPRLNLSDYQRSERIILRLCVAGMILGLLLSSTRLGYDAAAEYFSHAKIMAVSHLAVFFHPKDFFVVSSFHPGILFTAVIQLFGDQSARLLSWVNGVFILLIGLALGQELGVSRRAHLWFLTLMVTSTAFVDLLGDGKVELISTAPILGAIYWMIHSIERPTKGIFVIIGLLAGFAIISRPYNIFLVSVFIAMFFISQAFVEYRSRRFNFRQSTQSILWMMVPLFALGVFHLFQNWIWLKNPLAPLFYAQGLDSDAWQWQLNPTDLIFYRLFYPLVLTFLNSPQSLGNLSPLLIGALPFLIMKGIRKNLRPPPLLGRLTVIATLTLLLWIAIYFTVLEIRYVLFLWVVLFLAVAQILECITQNAEMVIRPLLSALVITFLAVMGGRTFIIALTGYLPYNDISPVDCHDTNLCTLVETINKPAAPGDRVFVLHAYRYYLRSDLFACSSRVTEYSLLESLARQNPSEFWVELYRRGYQYVMFEQYLSEELYVFGKLPDPNTAPDWLQIKVLYASPSTNHLIYQLESTNPPFFPEISCKQDSRGQWQLLSSSAPPLP